MHFIIIVPKAYTRFLYGYVTKVIFLLFCLLQHDASIFQKKKVLFFWDVEKYERKNLSLKEFHVYKMYLIAYDDGIKYDG